MVPRRVSFGKVESGKSAAREVTVRIGKPETIKIVSASVEDERFLVQQTGGDSVNNALYSLTFEGAKKPESIHSWLEILYHAGEDEPKRKRVRISAEVVEDAADQGTDAKVQ